MSYGIHYKNTQTKFTNTNITIKNINNFFEINILAEHTFVNVTVEI